MTNPALDALNRFKNADFSDRETQRCLANEIEYHFTDICNSLANAPEVVTPVEFDKITMANYMSDVGLNETEFLMKRFPHGLKIIADKKENK